MCVCIYLPLLYVIIPHSFDEGYIFITLLAHKLQFLNRWQGLLCSMHFHNLKFHLVIEP